MQVLLYKNTKLVKTKHSSLYILQVDSLMDQDITWYIVGPCLAVVLILIVIGKSMCENTCEMEIQ